MFESRIVDRLSLHQVHCMDPEFQKTFGRLICQTQDRQIYRPSLDWFSNRAVPQSREVKQQSSLVLWEFTKLAHETLDGSHDDRSRLTGKTRIAWPLQSQSQGTGPNCLNLVGGSCVDEAAKTLFDSCDCRRTNVEFISLISNRLLVTTLNLGKGINGLAKLLSMSISRQIGLICDLVFAVYTSDDSVQLIK
jgi:hypothetical protein